MSVFMLFSIFVSFPGSTPSSPDAISLPFFVSVLLEEKMDQGSRNYGSQKKPPLLLSVNTHAYVLPGRKHQLFLSHLDSLLNIYLSGAAAPILTEKKIKSLHHARGSVRQYSLLSSSTMSYILTYKAGIKFTMLQSQFSMLA